MSNINLMGENQGGKDNKPKAFGAALVLPIVLLLLVLAAYGVILFFNFRTFSELKNLESQYKSDYDEFLSGSGGEVLDFQRRSEASQELLSDDLATTKILGELEDLILPSVYLDSFQYEKENNQIILGCIGSDFNSMAKQVLSFKNSGMFSTVEPSSGNLEDDSRVNFVINLKIK